MPAQRRLGLDEEDRPGSSGQNAADRGKQRPIGRLERRPWGLAAQHGELVTQHRDLEVLGGVTAGQQGEELDGAAQRQVGELGQHKSVLCGGWQKRHHTEQGRREPAAHIQLVAGTRITAGLGSQGR
jgi:hypothetical protein